MMQVGVASVVVQDVADAGALKFAKRLVEAAAKQAKRKRETDRRETAREGAVVIPRNSPNNALFHCSRRRL